MKELTPKDFEFTIDEFRAWLEKQPAEATYEYFDDENCAMCQFFEQTRGLKAGPLTYHVGGYTILAPDQCSFSILPNEVSLAVQANEYPRHAIPFHAVLSYLNRLCPNHQTTP